MANAIVTVTGSRQLTSKEIKEFGSIGGPWVTILLPVEVPGRARRNLSARIKAASAKAEQQISERGEPSTLIRRIIDPIAQLAPQLEQEAQGKTLALFISDQDTKHYWLDRELPETVIAAANPYVRPMLDDLNRSRTFYLLALDQKNIRLLRCSNRDSEEVSLAGRVPTSLVEFTKTDQPDHVLDNRSPASAAWGGAKMMFGTGTDRETQPEYLLHYFKEVSRGISEMLRGQEKTPLVVCGVEYELALFERVNTWANTCPEGVRGAPNSLKGGEMHARALECLDSGDDKRLEDLLAQHDKQAGDAVTAGVNELVKAAYDGRVLHLFAAANSQAMGNFDEAGHRARTHQVARSGDEDLINAAAVQTLAHGGGVHVLPQARVPGNRPMAAIMRY